MKYWLLKTEPDQWSFEDQIACGKKGSVWDGVRNYQARNNLKRINFGDQCFFYHTGKEKRIKLDNLCPLWSGSIKVLSSPFHFTILKNTDF